MYSDGPGSRPLAADVASGRPPFGEPRRGEPPEAGLVVRLVATDGALRRLMPEWWGLWERAGASPFASPAWVSGWWQVATGADLFVLAVRLHGELVGLAPLSRTVDGSGHHLRFAASGPGERDLILDPRFATESLAVLGKALGDYSELWDALTLDAVPPDGSALRLPFGPSYVDRARETGQSRIAFAAAGDELSGAGEVVDLADTTVMRLIDALFAVDPDPQGLHAFLLRAMPSLRASGLVDLSGVAVNGTIRAAQLGLLGRDRYEVVRVGGDGRLAAGEVRRRARLTGRGTIVADKGLFAQAPMFDQATGSLVERVVVLRG